MRRYLLLSLVIVAIGAAISPALGAPSIGKVASIAREALSISNQAKETAKRANRSANQARRIAARKLDLRAVKKVVSAMTIPPDDARVAVARCPSGMRVISGGAFTTALYNLFGSEPDDTSTAWLAGGDNIGSSISANVEATAYCARPGRAASARLPSGSARGQAIRAEVAKLLSDRRGATASR